MRASAIFILLLAGIVLLPAVPAADDQPPAADLVAYLPDVGAEISAEEIRTHISLYADFLLEQRVARADVKIMDTVRDLEVYVSERSPAKPTIGVINPLVVALMSEEWRLRPIAAPLQDGKALSSRVVLTLRGSGIESMDDLRGRSLVITKPWDELPDLLGLMLFGEAERADQGPIKDEGHWDQNGPVRVRSWPNPGLVSVAERGGESPPVPSRPTDASRKGSAPSNNRSLGLQDAAAQPQGEAWMSGMDRFLLGNQFC